MSDFVQGIVSKITSKEAGKSNSLVYNIKLNCNDTQQDEWFGHGFDEPIFYEGDEVSFDVEMNGDYANIVVSTVEVVAEGEAPAPKPKPAARGNARGSSSGRGTKPAGRGAPASGRSSGRGQAASGRGQQRSAPASQRSSRAAPAQKTAPRGARGGNASTPAVSKDQYWADKAGSDKIKDGIIQRPAVQNTAIAFIKVAIEAGAVTLPAAKPKKLDALTALVDEEAERLYAKNHDEEACGGGQEG